MALVALLFAGGPAWAGQAGPPAPAVPAGAAPTAQGSTLALSMDEAVAMALETSLGLKSQRLTVDIAAQNVAAHDQIATEMLEISRSDRGRQGDVVQAQSRLEQARANRVTVIGKLRNVRQSYIRLVGHQPDDVQVQELPGATGEGLDEVVHAHPAYRSSQAEAEAAAAAADVAKASIWPQVNVQASFTNERDAFNRTIGPTAGLVVSWNAFRGGSDAAAGRAAGARSAAARQKLMDVELDLRQQLQQALEDITTLRESARHLEARSVETDRVRQAYRELFKGGRRSLLDVLNAENEHFETLSSAASARYDLMVTQARAFGARAELASKLGLGAPAEPQR